MARTTQHRRHAPPPILLFTAAAAFYLLAACATVALTDPRDVAALRELRRQAGGPAAAAGRLASWVGEDPCASAWEGVACDGSGHVMALQLAGAGLDGPLPASFSMPSLRTLSLQHNKFTTIPSSFFLQLPSLTSLSLDYSPLNSSTGGWSLSVASAASLRHIQSLSLTSTFLTGPLPDFLSALPNLRHLHLAYNRLYGHIPASYAAAPFVSLQLNNQQGSLQLSGRIDAIATMPNLAILWLQVNAFSGPIPRHLAAVATIADLRLNDNKLVGTIPATIAAATSSLTYLALQHNHLQGPIPRFPSSLSLSNFTYQGNAFCNDAVGATCSPTVDALLDFLAALDFPQDISQSWPGGDPCTASAVWPGVSCDAASTVTALSLPRRRLSGTLSPSLARLTSLQILILDNNNLTGTIPSALASLPSLRRLSLRHNNFLPPLPTFRDGLAVDLDGNPQLISGDGERASSPSTTPPTGAAVSGVRSMPFMPPPADTAEEATPPPVAAAAEEKGRSKGAAVAGGVVGALLAALLAAFLAVFLVKLKRKKRRKAWQQAAAVSGGVGGGGRLLQHPQRAGEGSRSSDGAAEVVKCRVGDGESGGEMVAVGGGVQTVEAGDLVISIQVLRNGSGNISDRDASREHY